MVPTPQRRRAAALAARAGLGLAWVKAPDRAEVAARDFERMLADAAGEQAAGDAGTAGLLAAHGAERIAAAYRRLWTAIRPAPEALRGAAKPTG